MSVTFLFLLDSRISNPLLNRKVCNDLPGSWPRTLDEGVGKGILFWYLLVVRGRIEEVVTSRSLGSRLVSHLGVRALVFPLHSCMSPREESFCCGARVGNSSCAKATPLECQS